jgi:UDP-N-acetylmuramyl tripeptide synthase
MTDQHKQPLISIMVDYAHEPESMKRLLDTTRDWKIRQFFDKVIHVVSCDSAGRDDWKKPVMGSISYSKADFSVVTTENYDENDDPVKILNLLCKDFPTDTRIENIDEFTTNSKYIKEINRHQAMRFALDVANKMTNSHIDNEPMKILIISTGIGSEQLLIQPQGVIEHDEREEWVKIWNES